MKTETLGQMLTLNNDKDGRKTAEEMDESRNKTLAYEYLCHLEEAKKWLEVCLREKLPPATELEENLRNGVYLAKLGHFIAPDILPLNKIYDIEQKRYSVVGLVFRHTDNINHFLKCLKTMQLPYTFQPETTDIYDKKNMPRLVYCIHALSTHLFKLGKAPLIQDLYGKINFTEDEIDAVSKELKRMGIQMPSFQKIGGLLTNSMTNDSAALHAAVLAINQSLSSNDQKALLPQLQNPTALLKNINVKYLDLYHDTLMDAKQLKAQGALNRSLNDSYVPDAYDELLTQAEIQGHINYVNVQCALENLTDSIQKKDEHAVEILKDPCLQLQNVLIENNQLYKKSLEPLVQSIEWEERTLDNYQYWQKKLQKIINTTNEEAKDFKKREEAVENLNKVLENGNEKEFYVALTKPQLGVTNLVDKFAIPLYYEEMKIDRCESKINLSHNDIGNSLKVLTAIANITKAVDTNNPDLVYNALKRQDAHIMNLIETNKVKYCRALAAVRRDKQIYEEHCSLLNYIDIKECIDTVNDQSLKADEVIDLLRHLNHAVETNSNSEMIRALKSLETKVKTPKVQTNADLYMKLFQKCLMGKHTDGSELWLEDVIEVNKIAQAEIEDVERACSSLLKINEGLEQNNMSLVIENMRKLNIEVPDEYKTACFSSLLQLFKLKKNNPVNACVQYKTSKGNTAHIDFSKKKYTWDSRKKSRESRYVSKDDINDVINSIVQDVALNRRLERLIVKLQAHIRGYLTRKKIAQMNRSATKIQVWWRKVLHRKMYSRMLLNTDKHLTKNLPLYSAAQTKSEQILNYYKKHERKIIKIQALWRGCIARKAFLTLLHLDKPPFSIVKYFSAILNFDAEDYEKEKLLQILKSEVVQLIKHNEKLSQQLDKMDLKIGLLVQNRITFQDVLAHGKDLENLAGKNGQRLQRKNSFSGEGYSTYKGLKSLTKESRKMLEGYQHLFYVLQTNPSYLSKLLIFLPQSKSNKFVHNFILKLFNYGSNSREEYLLLKLLGTTLQEEISSKVLKPSEVVTGTPLVLKVAVNYARKLNGQNALREIIGPMIDKMLDDRTISIETSPIDLYKCWRNQMETNTGEASNLPNSVDEKQALRYEQVRKKLKSNIKLLQVTVLQLMDRIISSKESIPYGILYMAKVLYKSLRDKFPDTAEKEILKIVGNLIYYQYINPAIVTPDAFDIIDMKFEKLLTNEQRKNLASVAKILHFASSKKGFGIESQHLLCLNPFIVDLHEKFKIFFRDCCQIEDLDDHFSMSEYTEATLIQKPEVAISLQEVCDTHGLLIEYQYQIAPDPLDSLHELLEDLGNVPTVPTLLGLNDPVNSANVAHLGQTEICLELKNKFEIPNNDDDNLRGLFIKTKELLVSMLGLLKGENLIEALETKTMSNGCNSYNETPVSRFASAAKQKSGSASEDFKNELRANLNKLELEGLVSRSDGYQTLITAIAKDLRYKGDYRILRDRELQMLQNTKQRLEEKSKYYEKQVECYNEYINTCLENLNSGKGTLRAMKASQKNNHGKLKSKMTLKYSAAKLQEKGILLEVDGLPSSQFKNVIFEIVPTDRNGVFAVRSKFMGVEMETVDVDVQRLLQLQFEGAHIMDIFGQAKINVNLLLYLLNRKFYGKN